eukprot:scaffold105409_cov41-Prasinocladus_malaysianus.AAC.2
MSVLSGRAGRASETGFHYDATTLFMALDGAGQELFESLDDQEWREAVARFADIAVVAGYTPVLPESSEFLRMFEWSTNAHPSMLAPLLQSVGCKRLAQRGWRPRDVVVAGYKPFRCYLNTGELFGSSDTANTNNLKAADTAGVHGRIVKCGDRQLLHPAALHDDHFRSLVHVHGQTLDIGALTTYPPGPSVASCAFIRTSYLSVMRPNAPSIM